jgi:hypothetical protein
MAHYKWVNFGEGIILLEEKGKAFTLNYRSKVINWVENKVDPSLPIHLSFFQQPPFIPSWRSDSTS